MEHVKEHEHEVMVKVSYPNSMASKEFEFQWCGTLQQLWDLAYTKLGEGKKPEDELLNRDGAPLGEHLNLTLREAHEHKLCPGFIFTIKSETGGAHPDPEHGEHDVMVKVSYPNSMASTEFEFPWCATLQQLWELAYTKLGEGKKPEDEFLNRDGAPLGEHLNLTLREAHEHKLCPGFIFTIKSETGGAHPDPEHGEHDVMVKVSYPNSMASTEFEFPWCATLQQLWELAYTKLGEGKKPEDEFLNRDGAPLEECLNLTLREAHERNLCPGFIFTIKSETGGANPDYGRPIPNTPSEAASAFEGHLADYLKFRNASNAADLGMQVTDDLTLIVPLVATGNGHNDEYTLRLHFGYYPSWPPSARFVNPNSLSYDMAIDRHWLPSIQGTNEIAVHPDYNGQGQLVCNSMTLEFYVVNHSYSKPQHLWQAGLTFESTLAVITWALNSPFYQGRQAS